MTAYRHTAEQPEICGYVSDDFELFALALLRSYEDAWLNALWRTYSSRRCPHGVLTPVGGKLVDLLE